MTIIQKTVQEIGCSIPETSAEIPGTRINTDRSKYIAAISCPPAERKSLELMAARPHPDRTQADHQSPQHNPANLQDASLVLTATKVP